MKKILLILGVLLLAAMTAAAQGHGSGQQKSRGASGKGAQSGNVEQGRGNTQREHLQVTEQQRDRYRTCTQTAERIRQRAREIASANPRTFDSDKARRQRDQIREELQRMDQEHLQLMQVLNEAQRTQAERYASTMEKAREHVRTHLKELDEELSGTTISQVQVNQSARELEQAMKEWQKRHREMASQIGLS